MGNWYLRIFFIQLLSFSALISIFSEQSSDGQADYLLFSDVEMSRFCQKINRDCSHVIKVFTYDYTTTYLAISKHWLRSFARENMFPMHESNGVIKLWEAKEDE